MHFKMIAMMSAPIALLSACSGAADPQPEPDAQESADAPASSDTGGGLVLDNEAADGAALVESGGSAASFDADCVISETGAEFLSSPSKPEIEILC